MSQSAWLDIIRNYLVENGPQLLSTLGEQIKAIARPEGSLREALEENGINIRREGKGPKLYAYLDEQVEQIDSIVKEKDTPVFSYRKAVLIAFCKPLEENFIIGLILQPKVRYIVTHSEDIPKSMIPIETEFRHPELDINYLTAQDKTTLSSSIHAWCSKHKVEEIAILKDRKYSPPSSRNSSLETIIKLFLEAQPSDIRHKVNIPLVLLEQLINISK